MKALFIIILQGLLMLAVAAGPMLEFGNYDFSLSPFWSYKGAGLLINLFGLMIVLLGVSQMGMSFTVLPKPKSGGQLVTTGIFSFTRNPIYFGGLILCLGWSISFKSGVSGVSTLLLFFVLNAKMRMEEEFLTEKFGPAYTAYKSAVSRLIPFVW